MATAPWHVQMLYQTEWIPQGTTARYSVQLTDESGTPITLTQLTTITLTIYHLDAQPPVVLVPARDVKNVPANGGAVSSSGLLTLTLSPTDNGLVSEARRYEHRRWQVIYTFATGSKTQVMQIDRIVANVLEAL